MNFAGRWSLLYQEEEHEENATANTESVAWALLRRYGVVFRRLAERENLTPPWRDLVRTFRTLEARGQIRGGRFVDGVWGEQFALPEAIVELRKMRKQPRSEKLVSISAADPLNLTGIITPGRRVPGYSGNRILYSDGVPVAVMEGGEVQFLVDPADKKWIYQQALVRQDIAPRLRKYLVKS
jgi:ATP-dependent Lhr-like helicase